MNTDCNGYDEDEDFDYQPFYILMMEAIGPKVKQYLYHHFGNSMTQLEAETYLEIEKTIKAGFMEADMIPDLLYQNRSITDSATFETALQAYVRKAKTFNWPEPTYWFDKEFVGDDQEDSYLEDSDPEDLNASERKDRGLLASCDTLLDEHATFANFTKNGFEILNNNAHQYLEDVASFDLEILTEEGFKKLQECIFYLLTELLNEVYGVVQYDLRNKG